MCDFANFDNRRKIEIRNERLLGIPVLYLQVYCTLHNKNKKNCSNQRTFKFTDSH